MERIIEYKYILMPFLVWFGIQLFKVSWYYFNETKKWEWSRLFQNGGMPSAHSAVVTCLSTMVLKSEGITSITFAISVIFTIIVMTDAIGVRRNVGEHARVLNEIIKNSNKTGIEKLQEITGHNPVQVFVGALIGLIVGLIF